MNTGQTPLTNITTYLSLADTADKLPVDLEDWSAEKGLYIGNIDSKQALPLTWKIHLVKQGQYSLVLLALVAGNNTPITSSITYITVKPKQNLNPGRVLPVVLGVPILVIFLLLFINYFNRRKN